MKGLPIFLFLALSSSNIFGQSKIEWSEDRMLRQDDFLAPAPNTGTQQTIYTSMIIEFGFQNYQLIFSNLNSNVVCYFLPSSSWLDEGDQTEKLLKYAQIQWHIQELGARKLRKKFFENRMSLGQHKMNELYEEISEEIAQLQSEFSKETDFGNLTDKVTIWNTKINQMLLQYSEYCQNCKAPKKKKSK